HELTRIDPWYLHEIAAIVAMHRLLETGGSVPDGELLLQAKRLGFSDQMIDDLTGSERGSTRRARVSAGIRPKLSQIDTTAPVFPAQTNYLYSTYHAQTHEVERSGRPKVIILGSGVYRIGSSVEFDWCCVSAARAASQAGYETVMVNYNPETVSTDYD